MRRILILFIIGAFILVGSAGFAAVNYRSSGSSPGAATGTSCVVVTPAGLASGDLMIGHILWSSLPGTVGNTIVAPSGWLQVQATVQGTGYRSATFWKVADSTDAAAANFTFTNTANASNLGVISAWTGFDTTTPIGASSAQANTTSTKVTTTTITTTAANSMLLLLGSIGDNATDASSYAVVTSNPSWTEAYDTGTAAGSDSWIVGGYAIRPEVTATGTGTITMSASDTNIGFLIAITPAAVTTRVIVVD